MCASPTNDLGLTDKDHDCACTTDGHTEQLAAVSDDVIREHYLVDGMTCNHCVASVTEELSAIDGVDSVTVDLNAGGTSRVMVVSARPVPIENVRAAVTEAGYALGTS